MKKMILLLITSVFLSASYAQPVPNAETLIKSAMQRADHIKPSQLKIALRNDDKLVLIDVRQTSEQPILGLITENDISIPRGYLEIRTYKKIPDLNTNIVVYCGKGIRSAFAANTLTEMGYKNVRSLRGGVAAWIESGYTTIDP